MVYIVGSITQVRSSQGTHEVVVRGWGPGSRVVGFKRSVDRTNEVTQLLPNLVPQPQKFRCTICACVGFFPKFCCKNFSGESVMRKPKGYKNHECCPADWKQTSDITGSFELDATILRTRNNDMRDRLSDHLTGDQAYERNTAYNHTSID
jgi:hypothetical protein